MAQFLNEILLHVFEYLNAFDLTKASVVCKQWLQVSRSGFLWRKLLLIRWPTQRFLFEKCPLSSLNWLRTYQELAQRGNFSSDEMKYLVSCKAVENELVTPELRNAMFHRMAQVLVKWKAVDPNEAQNSSDFPECNRNLELLYDTWNLRWVFVDKRRGYMLDESIFSGKAKVFEKSKRIRYVRSYQVMASCLAMYRWLCLFRAYCTREIGLTFYRVWRYRLRHMSSSLIFELFDWKAAMSCTLSNGCPYNKEFRKDCVELMDLLAHPNFIMHPMGIDSLFRMQIERQVSETSHLGVSTLQSSSMSSVVSNTDLEDIMSPDCSSASKVPSLVDSDDDSDNESDYVTNCNYFICTLHWDIEEQHTIQTSVAERWVVSRTALDPQLLVLYDHDENSWKLCHISDQSTYCCHKPVTFCDDEKLGKTAFFPEEYEKFPKAIPSCLALYRLLCLIDLNAEVYVNWEESSVWMLHLRHKQTSGILHLKDINGWFCVSVTLPHYLLGQLNVQSHSENLQDLIMEGSSERKNNQTEPDSGFRKVAHIKTTELEILENDIKTLLNLLMDKKFAHPYGTVAGSVA